MPWSFKTPWKKWQHNIAENSVPYVTVVVVFWSQGPPTLASWGNHIHPTHSSHGHHIYPVQLLFCQMSLFSLCKWVWLVSVHLQPFPLLVTWTVDYFCWKFYFLLNSVKLVFFNPSGCYLQVNSFEYFLFSFYLVLCFVELCKMNNWTFVVTG